MPTQLSADTRVLLRQYVDGQLSIAKLAEWLVQMEYDSDVTGEERDVLAQIRLTLIEASEGLRPKDDILESVAAALALSDPETRIITDRSSSATSWEREAALTTTSSRVERVGISA